MIKVLLLFIVFLLFSCGKAPKDHSPPAAQEEVDNEGVYSGVFIPVNPKISSTVSGEVKVSRYGDDFRVSVHLRSAPNGTFTQFLHLGSLCPRSSEDLNSDGYIDYYESTTATDAAIVPLDGDLGSQPAGAGLLLRGNYQYSRSTSYALMLSDLHLPDDIANDGIAKLPTGELPLSGRVVVVYINRTGSLPGTVSGTLIPVACTMLTKVSNDPDPDNDDTNYEPPPRRRKPHHGPPPPPPAPAPCPPNENPGPSWWERVRDSWNTWRERMNDWWDS